MQHNYYYTSDMSEYGRHNRK